MMNLVKWNPWREMPTLHNRMSRMFNDPFYRIGQPADEDSLGMWNPAVDLYEKGDHFVIKRSNDPLISGR
jgi:HSP20 family protein